MMRNWLTIRYGRAKWRLDADSLPYGLIGVRIVPHARTLRKAREQVKIMVATGFSTRRIRSYLKKWALWWAITSETWNDEYLLQQFFKSCWDFRLGEFAADLLANTTSSRTSAVGDLAVAA
jgi:hypothetical protein